MVACILFKSSEMIRKGRDNHISSGSDVSGVSLSEKIAALEK